MQESGKPMEFGIFDFYVVFQGLLVRKGMDRGDLNGSGEHQS